MVVLDTYHGNAEILDAACDVLSMLIRSADFVSVMEGFNDLLLRASQSPLPQIAKLAVVALEYGLQSTNIDALVSLTCQ